MIPIAYPQITHVEVVATQPQPSDLRVLDHLRDTQANDLDNITYIVKISLSSPMPATSSGVTLYVGDYRVTRYMSFPGGVYFKVHDPQFFDEHGGDTIAFSTSGLSPHDTGYQLPTSADNLPDAATPAAPDDAETAGADALRVAPPPAMGTDFSPAARSMSSVEPPVEPPMELPTQEEVLKPRS